MLIFRDPVSNVEGLRRKWATFGKASLAETIGFYREIHECFLEATESFPERVTGVEYETLVDQYEAGLARIGANAALAPARRRRRLPSSPDREGKGIRNVRGGRIPLVTTATSRAQSRLDPAQIDEIREALDPLRDRMRRAPFMV